ncbi:TonB-dependent receptor [Paludibacter propionicigenes WB4]|uniref:TonB-dependent receptor n=1 Tax=Paludibacter propionicigenes (strain DSM 17365 / JCM 13257 / WB4) TaxID=694427 RepID=E4T4V1_PALPW|nr:TonB-dependent receptor [Paludibacter propionicigenes]ADQ79745.1 TonB-dependent receptor [Paludibacter propionicigenes WB4]
MAKLPFIFGNGKTFLNNSLRKYGVLFLFAVLTTLAARAQQIEVSGKILEEGTKLPVIGATVKVKGQQLGTVSDATGEFRLKVRTLPVTLNVSIVGYRPQEIDVYEAEPTTIYLTEDQNRLSTVVVIGYGTQKRSDFTGSLSSISVPQIKESGQTSFVNALQGLASGVQVTQTSGAPGGASTIRIRGGNSITGGNEPLYVIDGFPVYNNTSDANAGALNGGLADAGTRINPLSSINPEDIESIDILKDASSTAIYGSRGANGVIIITTKRGKTGVGKVTYTGSYGVQQVAHKIDLLSGKEWAQYKNDALINAGKSPLYTQTDINALNGTDWQNALLRDASIQSHNIGIIGGTDKNKYSVSVGYLDQQGIIINTGYKRYNARVALDSKVNEKFTLGVNFNNSYSTSEIAPDGILKNALFFSPLASIYDNAGNYTLSNPYITTQGNPVAYLNEATNISKTNRLLSSGFGEYEIIKGLKAKFLIGADLIYNKQNSYIPSTILDGQTYGGLASVGFKSVSNVLNENTITYNKTIANKHNLEFLGGFTQQQSVAEGAVARSSKFTNDVVEYNDLASGATLQTPSSVYSKWTLLSYLGRATYNYNQKYFASVSFRADGSSRLGRNNRWGYFPSLSFAWQADKEVFLNKFVESAKISKLKFRASAGTTGSQEIAPYQSLSVLTAYTYPTATGTLITGYSSSQIPNPDLKWETTNQYNAGFDIGFFKDRINLVFDAYYKKTNDLLLAVAVPLSSGYTSSLQNIGSVGNKGLEVTLNTENIKTKNFTWTTDITYSINRNKVLSLNEGTKQIFVASEIQTGNAIIVGQPLGTFWGYKTDGLYRNTSEIPTTPLIANTKVGDVKYLDLGGNADGSPDGKITQAGDQTTIGNAQPDFIFGFTNNLRYKNFDLSIFLNGSVGNQIYSYFLQQLMTPTGYQNVIGGFADHYTADNTSARYQRPNENITTNAVSDLYVYNASYLRLKSLTLGYTLPKSLTKKIKIEKLRIYATGNNLLTITSYPGFDPEVNFYDSNSSRQGVDFGSYPSSKTYTAGVSITF